MCGRFSLAPDPGGLEEMFPDLAVPREMARARYNIAPSQAVLAVVQEGGERAYRMLRWGLVPSWAKDAKPAASMINARAESVATKPAFRTPFRQRRCLVVADGFYEWRPDARTGRKQPYHIRLATRRPFAFAALWDRWVPRSPAGTGEAGAPVESCTIVTTDANEVMREIHDRMPVILLPESFGAWLDTREPDLARVQGLLVPLPDGLLEAYPVSTRVNSPRTDDAGCQERLVAAPPDRGLELFDME